MFVNSLRVSDLFRTTGLAALALAAAAGTALAAPCCPPSECDETAQKGASAGEASVWLRALGDKSVWAPHLHTALAGAKIKAEAGMKAAHDAMAQAHEQLRAYTVQGADAHGQPFVYTLNAGPDGDGKTKVRVFGKAIIVGPDGAKQVFNFGDSDENDSEDDDAAPQSFQWRGAPGAHGQAMTIGPNGLLTPGQRFFSLGGGGASGSGASAGGAAGQSPAWIGVQIAEPDEATVEGFQLTPGGATRIDKVIEGSPAQRAGIQDGDVIVRIEGRDAAGISQLQEAVRDAGPGRKVRVEVLREGQRLPIVVRPEPRVVVEGVPLQPREVQGFRFDPHQADAPAPGQAQDRLERIEDRMNRIERLIERLNQKLDEAPAPARRAAPAPRWRSGSPSYIHHPTEVCQSLPAARTSAFQIEAPRRLSI